MTTTAYEVGARYTVAVPTQDNLATWDADTKKRVVATMLNLRMSGSGVYEGTTGVLLPVPPQFADDPIFEGVVNFLPDNEEPDSEGNGWPVAREMLVPADQSAAVPSADFRTF